jgi:NAD(P)-dependent dehydrogenase (short-subunit alcohol dehydrogenase family)
MSPSSEVALVTGGSGELGRAICRRLARQCGVIAVHAHKHAAAANALVEELQKDGVTAVVYEADLRSSDETEALIWQVNATHGRIDVLVNNAGMTSADRFDERSVESIELELNVNLYAPLMLTRLAVDLLRAAPDPRVVTTVSLGGIFPLGETPIYTASKFGLRGAMLSISLDLRTKGILAGSVLPSATDTRMLRQEALDGGNALQFQDPPQTPDQVAKAMMKVLDKRRIEVYPKLSESWLVKTAMLMPNALPRLMPLFRGKGERGMKKYLDDLRRRGLIETVDGVDRLTQP